MEDRHRHEIAEVIGRRLKVPVDANPSSRFVRLRPFVAVDNPKTSSERTRELLGWQPQQPELTL